MIITVASYKGGVGKTTTAVHLAAYLDAIPDGEDALLLDGDPTKNATAWSQRAATHPKTQSGFRFRVAPIEAAAKLSRVYGHIVIDTGQRPSVEDLKAAVDNCDLLVIPAVPSALDTDGLVQTIGALQKIPGAKYKVLFTRVPADAARSVAEIREGLAKIGAPVFRTEIPRLKAFEKAAGFGVTVEDVVDYNRARAWESYFAVGMELGL